MAAFVIGIGGGSASGKSTIAEALSKRLAPLSVCVLNQDRYFWDTARLPRHSSRDEGRTWPDHNHPESFDLDRLYHDLRAAKEGSAEVVILEGILVLWDERIRGLTDLRLFVEAEPDERIVRRIRRNLAWGYELDGICDFYLDSVRYRHREFCQPTKAYAHIVIPGGKDDGEAAERALAEAVGRTRAAVEATA